MKIRTATAADAAAVAAIYNETIQDRVATFETRPRAQWKDGVLVERLLGDAAVADHRRRA